jgi:antitoxin component of MazEF toxin-antitoxin module
MPAKGETRAVREVKEAMQKTQAKRSKSVEKTVDNHQSIGHPPVSNETVAEVSNESLHRQPIGHSSVSYNSEEHYKESIKSNEYKDSLKNTVIGNQEIKMLIENGMTIEQVREAEELIAPLFAAEGLTPSSAVMSQAILQMHRDAR